MNVLIFLLGLFFIAAGFFWFFFGLIAAGIEIVKRA